MNRLYFFSLLLIIPSIYLFFASEVSGEDQNKFVTIVNPVRISKYSKNPEKSLSAEYEVIKTFKLPATWLLTYDTLSNKKVVSEILKMDSRQEFGIFLEVTPDFGRAAEVAYRDTGFWQHANSVFLSGYTQDERGKLIDKVFEKYKEVFGKYPKSIGSWWTDGYSLRYIKEKYGVVANLVCSDQYSTDGYQIWGQPWQMPYYPSMNHPAVPASDSENKLDIVNIQWAPRDPLNGYESSLYSTQDYVVVGKELDTNYFKKLVNLYTSPMGGGKFGQITVGLEADLDPEGYAGEYARQMSYIKSLEQNGVSEVTMSDFADWYRNKFTNISPSTTFDTPDFLGTKKYSYWAVTPYYRLFYVKEEDKNIIRIKDLRIYNQDISDPYTVSPNSSFNLSINVPAVIDSLQNPESNWEIPGDSKIVAGNEKITISGPNISIPKSLKLNPLVVLNQKTDEVEISFSKSNVSKDGVEIRDYSSEATHFFKQKKAFFYLLTGRGWNYFKKVSYSIPQGEIYALYFLKSLPGGNVMVYRGECLQCEYHTPLKPPAFSGLKDYVNKYSGKPLVYNQTVFDAKTRDEAKKEFTKTGAKYVYLVKFENYTEKLPFSPGDLGVEKLFSNANAEIWRVK